MQAIRLDFDPNSLSRVQNLVAVLEFIRGNTLGIKEYKKGAIPEPALAYIEQFKEEQGLAKEVGLSSKVIQRINEVWIEKKYQNELYISELHTWLTTLSYEINPEEIAGKFIGATTQAALEKAQQKYQLSITGTVTVPLEQRLQTAYYAATNRGVQEELLQVNDVNRLQKIIPTLSLNDEGERVQHLQVALVWLGFDIYKSEYRNALFGKQTRLAVIAYQKANELEASGKLTKEMAAHLNSRLLVSKPSLLDGKTYRVRGSVKDANWEGMAEMKVEVYEQLLRGAPQLLGTRTTAKNGFYDLIYTPPIAEATGKPKTCFHLLVQIKDPKGTLLKEATFFNVLPTTWMNYTGGTKPYLGASLYEEQLTSLEKHLSGLSLEEIEESEKNQDIKYLNACSGLGGNEIMQLSLAHRIAKKWEAYRLDPSLFYALFRQGLPQSLPSYLLPDERREWFTWINQLVDGQLLAIALLPKQTQETALRKAVEDNLIPIKVANQLDDALASLDQLRLMQAETAPIIGADVSLKDLLEGVELGSDQRAAVIKEFSEYPAFTPDFVQTLKEKKILDNATEQQLNNNQLLYQLGNYQKTATNQLKASFFQEGYSTVVRQVSDFAKWTETDWQLYLNNQQVEKRESLDFKRRDVAKSIAKSSDEDPKDLYRKAVAMAPTVATLASLGRSNKNSLTELAVLSTQVDEQQWLNLIEVPLFEVAKDPDSTLSEVAVEELKTVQRVQKIAGSPEVTAMLIDGGVQSAQKAFSMGAAGIATVLNQGGFGTIGNTIGQNSGSVATHIFNTSQQQVGAVLGLGTAIQLIGDNQLATNVLPKLANLDELFGSTDTCACAHCRSVYSPAAYLTDLLQWLKQRDTSIQSLMERRPDLEYILLNCKNATTPLPYIDLVNEVLEYAISQDPDYLERNTTWTAEELRLGAEYQLDAVYERFAALPNDAQFKPTASYSGFNLWQSQFHLYLEKLGIDTLDLVQQLGNYTSTTSRVLAETAAYFKMPSHEVYDVVTGFYDYANHPAASNQVEQFLKHHQLTYEQLIELLQCEYINAGGGITIDPIGTCDLSTQSLAGLNNIHYNKIWRFLRLWKYTGWELRELDLLIQHPLVGQGNLDLNTLEQLLRFHQIQQQFSATVEQCLTLFGNLNTKVWYTANNTSQPGLYQKVYLADHLEADLSNLFDPASLGINLQALTVTQLNYLAAALSTNVSRVQTILGLPTLTTLTQTTGTAVQLAPTLEALSNLYAYQFLSEQLDLFPEDLVTLGQLLDAGNNIFQSLQSLQQFLEKLNHWQAQGISVAEVRYLLRDGDATDFLAEDTVLAWHQELQELQQAAYDTLLSSTDDDRTLLAKLLGQTDKFPDERAIQDFLDLLEDPAILTPIDLAADVPVFFDYLSVADQNTLITRVQTNDPQTVTVLKQHLHNYLNQSVVYDFLAAKMEVAPAVLDWILSYEVNPDEAIIRLFMLSPNLQPLLNPATANMIIFSSYHYTYKLARIATLFDLNADTFLALEQQGSLLGLIKPTNVYVQSSSVGWTIQEWNATAAWAGFCKRYEADLGTWLGILNDLNTNNDFAAFFASLEQLLGWDATVLNTMHTQAGWAVADYLNLKTYQQLAQLMLWLDQSKERVDLLLQWPTIFEINSPDYISNQKLFANQVQQSLQHAVAPSQWATYQQQIQDKIRLQKRDALVTYARHFDPSGGPVLWSEYELYNYYLIDPQMSACQYTSRIKQAISSVQLFVQRCLMGLEGAVSTTDEAWKQWKWMQNYRVWEANRKVFLYPENWIEPSLRPDKSELFQQFEDQILQGEITNENVEKALRDYLVKLNHISNLEMKSICRGADSNTIYVLARTKENPADYYYRKLDKQKGAWTAWEKIEPAIKGEHPVLQFYNNRLHIFWLEILERPQRQVLQHDTPPTMRVKGRVTAVQDENTIPESPKFKEIQLAWVVLYETGWSPQTLSKNKLIHPWPRPNYSLHLRPRPKLNDLWLDIYVSTSLEFNSRAFYNQYNNAYEKLTTETFNENQAPWHSSSFVFDGFVREIKLKPISGTYWYVGWEKQLIPANTYTQTIPLVNSGPIWIRNLQDVDLSATEQNPSNEGEVKTNYGSFDLRVSTERQQLQQLIHQTKVNSVPALYLLGAYKDTVTNRNKFRVLINFTPNNHFLNSNISIQGLTKEELNSYIHTGVVGNTINEPTTNQVITNYNRKLVPASNPDQILRLENSDSHEYIYHSFDKDGRQLKKLEQHEQATSPAKLDKMHYEYNHVVWNKNDKKIDAANSLKVWGVGFAQKDIDLLDYQLTFPMDGQLSIVEQYKDLLYQDDFRSFYVGSSNLYYYTVYSDTNTHTMYHPLVRSFIGLLGSGGMDSLYERGTQFLRKEDLNGLYNYRTVAVVAGDIRRREEVSFDPKNGYSVYNWEIFFHIPLLIATELGKNQRFEEAMQWFHFIFNPIGVTDSLPTASPVSKYWITKPFFEQQNYQDYLIQNLLGGTLSSETENAITTWQNNPFQPYVVANMRPVAFQKAVVMKYLDNLIAWGDQLFRRETLESINQAALRYVVAAEILGDRPNTLAGKNVEDKDYASIKTALDEFSNTSVSVQLENLAMWTQSPIYNGTYPNVSVNTTYFCIPKNEKLAGYWDLVADRLFKIRHCMNIDGVVRQLPLFAPPIDPALLVNAQANGVDLGAVLNDLSLPKSHYKYRTLARTATQFCSEVKGLGQSLLSALQSKDAEGMALLQAGNAIKLLDATVAIKELQIAEAEESIKALEISKAAAQLRKDFYEGRDFMNRQESLAEKMNRTSITLDTVGLVTEGIAMLVNLIPKIEAVVSLPPAIKTEVVDGMRISNILRTVSGMVFKASSIVSKEASMMSTQASFHRRQEEWDLQAELATNDIEQIEQQIATAKIRVSIAKKDLANHELQIKNAESEQAYLQSKYTNQQLYSWMVGQISTIYFQAYQLAFDMAKKAEQSMRFELALPNSMPSLIKFGYWDSMKKGLLSGDKLMLAINKMEAAYLERNSRELELTKHISLHQLAPEALLELRTKGTCNVSMPAWWFDLDHPGHYLRRIKALSISIPCVTGPNTNVNCTLTMTQNSIQTQDGNWTTNYETQSIATSSAQNDAGVFELNFNSERFLPFEGTGAISTWTLSLSKHASFDYQSISDVVLHMRYTAKHGGAQMAETATTAVEQHLFNWNAGHPPVVLLSLKTAFSTAWHRFLNPLVAGDHQLDFEIMAKHYPYFSALFTNRTVEAAEVGVLLKQTPSGQINFPLEVHIDAVAKTSGLTVQVKPSVVPLYGNVDLGISGEPDLADWKLDFSGASPSDIAQIDDVFLILKYKLS